MEQIKDNIFEQCPKYISCSVNNCPLSIHYPDLSTVDDDPKCIVSRTIRKNIGKNTILKMKGLTVQEYAGVKRRIVA